MVDKFVRRTVTATDFTSAQAHSKAKRPQRKSLTHKSLTRAAQQRFVAQANQRGVMQRAADTALPVAPSKLEQLDARVRAGDPAVAALDARFRGHEQENVESRNVTSLTARVRALYEAGVVPVREIARLVGVSERTLYKYAARGGWRKRYARRALAKGAGGRFTAQDGGQDAGNDGDGGGLPAAAGHAAGLKALDPAAALAAAAACAEAGGIADEASAATLADHAAREARAAALHEFELRVRRLASLARVLTLLRARAA